MREPVHAVRLPARVLAGGLRPKGPGFFHPVTVPAEVPPDARLMREEPFGPLAVINSTRSLDEAIACANSLPFGLAGYAFTHDAATVDRLMNEVEVGNLSINTLEASVAEVPFGGVKLSGQGRGGGIEGMQHYVARRTVSHRTALDAEPTVSGARP